MRKIIILSLLLVAFCAVNAFAATGKIYPGSMGVKWTPSDPDPVLNYSAIINPSATKWLRLDLPVIHRIGSAILGGWVKAVDQHGSQNILTRLMSIYRIGCGLYGWGSPARTTNGAGCTTQTLFFRPLGSNNISHSYYSCHIPPTYNGRASMIVSYEVTENP